MSGDLPREDAQWFLAQLDREQWVPDVEQEVLPALRAAYRRGEVVGLDTECTPDNELVCWSIAWPTHLRYMGIQVYEPCVLLPEHVPLMARWLASDAPKTAHAGNGDAHRLLNSGATAVNNLHDTLSLSRLVQPHLKKHGLKELIVQHFGYEIPGKFGKLFRGRDLVAMTAARDPVWMQYAALDAKYGGELFLYLHQQAAELQLSRVF